jgi:hypothetical protein
VHPLGFHCELNCCHSIFTNEDKWNYRWVASCQLGVNSENSLIYELTRQLQHGDPAITALWRSCCKFFTHSPSRNCNSSFLLKTWKPPFDLNFILELT